jgi:hypothetical protein
MVARTGDDRLRRLYAKKADGSFIEITADGAGKLQVSSDGLSIPAHDAEVYGYTGEDLTTITYKTGGIAGTTVATMTLVYSVGKCTSRALVLS